MNIKTRKAFTLLELLISLALALLLILGINEVFALTAKTVGAGQVLSRAYRDDRAGQAVIAADFQQAAPMSTAPCLIIECNTISAYRNRAELNANVAAKVHRLDRIGLFARGLFARQTGTGSAFVDTYVPTGGTTAIPFSSSEAWIVYGHLNIANNSGAFSTSTFPGAGTASGNIPPSANPNNYFAAQWILGRSVFLLTKSPLTGTKYVGGTSGLAPLAYGSAASDGSAIQSSRYDVALTDITSYGQQLAKLKAGTIYWDPLVSSTTVRYEANPFLATKTLNSGGAAAAAAAAKVVPCFLAGCSDFAVEYTGDFITQDNTGTVTSAVPDGIPDYQIVNGVRQVRWYGLSRSTSPDGTISPANDVVPLSDVVGKQSFERALPATDGRYVVAWGPDTQAAKQPNPTMVRFTLTLDDTSNKTGSGQTFEYVMQLPQ